MQKQEPKRVLVADDDPDIVLILEQALKHEGYLVMAAGDGTLDALPVARQARH